MEHRPCVVDSNNLVGGYTRRVLANWRDPHTDQNRFLGRLDEKDPSRGDLFLRLGFDGKKLLICFYLPLRVHVKATGTRDVYFIIPAECLNTISTSVTTAKDDQDASELQKAGIDASSKILHMSLALKEQGYVVMPSRPPQTPVSVVIQSLLLCFRSLSRAKALKITIPYSESAEQLLNACSKALHEGLETPTIDYKKTYSGREWVRDDWTAYNINDYDETTLPVAWNPLVSDPPPAYVEHDGTAAIGNPTKAHLKHPDFSHQPRQMSPSIPDTESPSFSPPPVTPAASHTLGKRKRSHEDGSAESPSPSLPEDRRKIRYSHPPRQTSSSLADTLLPSSICSLPATLPLSSLLGELPAQDRSSPLPAEEGLPILPHRRFRISKRSAVGAGPNSALFDTGQWHLFNNALTWLTTAWDVLPAAHAVFLPELRTLAHAIRECDKATFNQTRVKCMVDLVRRERAAPCRGEGLWEREGGHGERVEEVTRWLYQHVGAEADTAVVHELLALDDMVRFLEMAERGEDRREEELCRRGLVIQMGTCIMVALFKTD